MKKKKKPFLDDDLALAADVNLTAITYTRIGASVTEWKLLRAEIAFRKKLMLGYMDN